MTQGSVVVGRFGDFEYKHDKVRYEGTTINLSNLPSNMKVVNYTESKGNDLLGNHGLQQWLLIETSAGGHIFYALEEAYSMTYHSWFTQDDEPHFIQSRDVPDFDTLPSVQFRDQQNWVPCPFNNEVHHC